MKAVTLASSVALVITAAVALAQPRAAPSDRARQLRLRYELQVMERVLEEAVQHGAQMMGVRLQATAPDALLFVGPARARGFRLDGYGVFFDVEVPALRESLTWSFRVLRQPDFDLARTLERVRQLLKHLPDEKLRVSLEKELAPLEARFVAPVAPAREAAPVAAGSIAAQAVLEPRAGQSQPLPPLSPDDPVAEYTAEVKAAIIDAILDHSGSLTLGPDEWLTVAARDAEPLAAGDLAPPPTILLRIRGADLAAFRSGRVSREEARRKVEVREF